MYSFINKYRYLLSASQQCPLGIHPNYEVEMAMSGLVCRKPWLCGLGHFPPFCLVSSPEAYS